MYIICDLTECYIHLTTIIRTSVSFSTKRPFVYTCVATGTSNYCSLANIFDLYNDYQMDRWNIKHENQKLHHHQNSDLWSMLHSRVLRFNMFSSGYLRKITF